MILLAGIASAATVAVLDFDGYGVAFSDAQVATQGVRDAFLEGGRLDPLSGSDIADGVSKGQDAALARARDLVAEARRLHAAGDASGAIGPLAEALGLHEAALSDVGRRPELADATFLYGACLLKIGRSSDARARFAEAAALVPSYARERGTRMSTEAAGMLAAAEDTLAKGPRKARPVAEIARIGEALSVDYVVTGWVTGDGALAARLYAGDTLLAEAKTMLEERPPQAVDGAYSALVQRLVEDGLSAPVVAEATEAIDPEEEAALDEEVELPDFGEGDEGDEGGDRSARAEEPARSGKVKITTKGAIRTKTPLVERWWFWTAIVGAAGGGTFGLWYALTPPPTVYEEESDGWTVTVPVE